jgi:hypothetical protein
MLANEAGKGRLNRDATSRKRRTWRTLVLSTGEVDIATVAAKAERSLPSGAEVRLPSLRATEETMWQELHGSGTSRDLMGRLQAALRCHYGIAGRVFLQHLVAERNQDPEGIAEAVIAMQKRFQALLPQNSDPQVHDVARRFALVAAAGEYASNGAFCRGRKTTHCLLARRLSKHGSKAEATQSLQRRAYTSRSSAGSWSRTAYPASSALQRGRDSPRVGRCAIPTAR